MPETVKNDLLSSGLKACGDSEGIPKSSDTRIFFNGGSLTLGGGRLLVELWAEVGSATGADICALVLESMEGDISWFMC